MGKKVNSKWAKGGIRYSPEEENHIHRAYRESPDFHQGARIRRVNQDRRKAA